MKDEPIIRAENLTVEFSVRGKSVCAVKNASFSVCDDEILAIVGESGSGKTVLMKTVSGLLAPNGKILSGDIYIHGEKKEYKNLEKALGKVFSFVFQDPASALNPVATVGSQISDVIIKHNDCSRNEAKEKAVELLEKVGIDNPEKRYDSYPFEYSGGMLQRAVIAAALACNPEILICDEATTSLDVITQYQIMELILDLKKSLHFSAVVITHDFGVAAKMADRIAVMHSGEIVETGSADDVYHNNRHPYTKALLQCLPQLQKANDRNNLYDCTDEPVLSVRNLHMSYGKGKSQNIAVNGVSFDVYNGEILSIVGESGSGKSTLGKALAGFKKPDSGNIFYCGTDIYVQDKPRLRLFSKGYEKSKKKELRRHIQMIFQNQTLSLNDRADIKYIISEGLNNFNDYTEVEKTEIIYDMLDNISIPKDYLSKYPHELSGGQKQRIGIARSLILKPDVVIADEPVSSLDVSAKIQILDLIKKFRDKNNTAFVFISHDMSVVRLIADRVIVMHKGCIVEDAPSSEIFSHPRHPYTKLLIESVPIPDPRIEKNRKPVNTYLGDF